jgi:sugar phosphate isomerase/epimerase
MKYRNRREFFKAATASVAIAASSSLTSTLTPLAGALGQARVGQGVGQARVEQARVGLRFRYCGFVKFIQSLSYSEMAKALVDAGYGGAEITVRNGGYILPEDVTVELPKLQEVFDDHGLKIDIITTDIVAAGSKSTNEVLATAAKLGIPHYRMGFCHYNLSKPIMPQLDALKEPFAKLAKLNREVGISGVYQNHSGARYVGATFWDLQQLLKEIPRQEIGNIFDVRHAAIEGGLAWPIYFDVIKPHIAAFSIKDYRWIGRKLEYAPFGKGNVDPEFIRRLGREYQDELFTVHVEYLPEANVTENLAAMASDLKVLKSLLEPSESK